MPQQIRKELKNWWLASPKGANTLNWDIASTCTIDGKYGVILVEAKAHVSELTDEAKGKKLSKQQAVNLNSFRNHQKIGRAINEARSALEPYLPGINISRDSNYQLSNRIAFAWKIASLGIPVVLCYLGFLRAYEMGDFFESRNDWENCLRSHCNSETGKVVVPEAAWNNKIILKENNVPFCIVARSIIIDIANTA